MTRLIYYMQQAVYISAPIICVAALVLVNYYIFGVSLTILTILIWGIFDIQLSLFIPTLNKINTKEKVVALTFDDGPSEFTEQILAILKQEDIKACFFVIGKNAEALPHVLQQIHNDGHEIGLHTQNHKISFPYMRMKKVRGEIAQNIEQINNIINIKPAIFRPPFGIMNPIIACVARELNLKVIGWSIRSFDTKISDEDKLIKRILNKLKSGNIILLHDTMPITVTILPQLIRQIKQNRYKFVTLPL